MLATTTTRSRGNSDTHREFERQAEDRLEWYASRPHLIERRRRELDEAWDIERAIEANAATLALTETVLSLTHDQRWGFPPLVVTGFLLQHATRGWCPIRRFRSFHDVPEKSAPGRRAKKAFDAAH